MSIEKIVNKNELKNNASDFSYTKIPKIKEILINHIKNLLLDRTNELDFDETFDVINKLLTNNNQEEISDIMLLSNQPNQNLFKEISLNKFVKGSELYKVLNNEFSSNVKSIKIIVPFISRQGISILKNLIDVVEDKKIKIKLLTTSFDGKASFLYVDGLKKLVNDSDNIEVKIQNNINGNSRIHAKSYIFERDENKSTVLVGSSNLTGYGVSSPNEWNIKVSEYENKKVYNQIKDTFDTFWNDSNLMDILDFDINIFEENYIVENTKNCNDNNVILRDYQVKVVDSILKRINEGKNKNLLVMATGTGKTVTIFYILNKLLNNNDDKFVFIAGKNIILEQAERTFKNIFKNINDGDIVRMYDSKKVSDDWETKRFIFATPVSLKNNLDNKDINFKAVVFDEAHHVDANGIKELFSFLEKFSEYVFGLTATPHRSNDIDVNKYFDFEYAVNLSLFESVKKGIVAPFDYWIIKDDFADLTGIKITDSKKNQNIINLLNSNDRFEFIKNELIDRIEIENPNEKTIIFMDSLENAELFSNYLNDNGLKSSFLSSKRKKENNQIFSDFKEGRIPFLIAVDMISEGVDVPDVTNVVFLRPTSSRIIYIQQLGRGLRKVKNKRLQVYDFVNNIDMNINKNYNPLTFFETITDKVIYNTEMFDVIEEYMPEDCNLFMTKITREEIKDKFIKFTSSSNRVKEIKTLHKLDINESFDYNYNIFKSFFNGINIFKEYGKTSFMIENIKMNTKYKQIISLNNKYIFNKFINIVDQIENDIVPDDDLMSKLFIGTFLNSPKEKKYNGKVEMFWKLVKSDTFLFELKLLLKYLCSMETIKDFEVKTIRDFEKQKVSTNQGVYLFGLSSKDGEISEMMNDKSKYKLSDGGYLILMTIDDSDMFSNAAKGDSFLWTPVKEWGAKQFKKESKSFELNKFLDNKGNNISLMVNNGNNLYGFKTYNIYCNYKFDKIINIDENNILFNFIK